MNVYHMTVIADITDIPDTKITIQSEKPLAAKRLKIAAMLLDGGYDPVLMEDEATISALAESYVKVETISPLAILPTIKES